MERQPHLAVELLLHAHNRRSGVVGPGTYAQLIKAQVDMLVS